MIELVFRIQYQYLTSRDNRKLNLGNSMKPSDKRTKIISLVSALPFFSID